MTLICENFIINCDTFIDIIKFRKGKKKRIKYGVSIHFVKNNTVFERNFIFDSKEIRDRNFNALLDSYLLREVK